MILVQALQATKTCPKPKLYLITFDKMQLLVVQVGSGNTEANFLTFRCEVGTMTQRRF